MTPESEPYISAAFFIGMLLGAGCCIIPMLMVMWSSNKAIKTLTGICDDYSKDVTRLLDRIKELEEKLHNDGEEWKR